MSLATKLKAGEARTRLQEVQKRTRALEQQLTTDLRAARSFNDPHLTADGLQAKRSEMEKAARAKLQTALAALRAEVDRDLQTVREFAEEDRPKPAVSEVKQARLWDRVRQLLDSGRSLRQVIAETDDPETLLAIREEAPTYMRVKAQPPSGLTGQVAAPDVDGLLRAIDIRLGETTQGLPALAVQWGVELGAIEAGLRPTLGYLEQEATGTAAVSGLHAAIESKMAAQAASVGLVDDAAEAAPEGVPAA